jgi:hypothetical protein
MPRKITLVCLALVFYACASSGINNEPSWIRDPYAKYDKQANIAAVGSGSSREAAEKSATGNLVAIFGQSIQVDEKVSAFYQEAVKNGVTASWSENTAVDTVISTSAGMDSLIGAEIGDVWNDGKDTYYAVAVLNKAKASQIYSGMVKSNQAMLDVIITTAPIVIANNPNKFTRIELKADLKDTKDGKMGCRAN